MESGEMQWLEGVYRSFYLNFNALHPVNFDMLHIDCLSSDPGPGMPLEFAGKFAPCLASKGRAEHVPG
jgi:hypothetical protein